MSAPNLRPGKVLGGRFVLLRRLGAGSSGVVWAAEDREGGEDVALKILHPGLAHERGLVGQLSREAKVLARLDHPHIARAIAFHRDDEFVFLAMELLDGQPLHEVIGEHTRAGRHFSNRGLARLVVQMCAGVAHAHGAGIVHRDLKPQNVIVSARGDGGYDAKVLDFGIARLSAASMFDATTLGRRMGSLFYMSPEQTRGEPADVRADVFALGTILFELLTLHRAWARGPDGPLPAFDKPVGHPTINSIAGVFERIAEGERPSPRALRPELPPSLDAIVGRALAIDPADRYPSVAAFANEARAALDVLSGQLEAADHATIPAEHSGARPGGPMSQERTAVADPEQGGLLPLDSQDTDRRAAPLVTPTKAFVGADPRLENAPVTEVPGNLQRPDPKSLALPPQPDLAHLRTVGLEAATSLEAKAPAAETPAPLVDETRPLLAAPERVAATAFLDSAAPRSAPPPGFAEGLEEAGPTVRERRPTAGLPTAPIETDTTARTKPRHRVGVALGLAGGALLGALLVLAVVGGEPAPAPVADPMPPPPMPTRARAEAPRHARLVALLSKVKADPEDEESREALVKGILQATEAVEDEVVAAEIRKIATLSSTVRNVEGLASCVARLEAMAD